MRVLFTPIAGGTTPLSYLVPLAWACRAAGHEVRVAAQLALTHAVTGAGLPAVEVGRDYDTLAAIVRARGGARLAEPSAAEWDRSGLARPEAVAGQRVAEWRAGARRAMRGPAVNPWVAAAQTVAADLVRFAERWRPHLVVADALVFAAPLVSARLGIPLVRAIWGPDLLRHIGYPMQGQAPDGDPRTRWPTGLPELYDAFGVPVRDDHPVATVDPWPTSLQLPGMAGRVPVRFVPFNGAAVAPDWVLDKPSRPRVCVTWGTTTTAVGGEEAFILPRVVDALARLDIEVVLAVSDADRDRLGRSLGALPGNVTRAARLPLHLVLPRCAAVVNQAGASTLLTAACHGLPQVLIPQTAECPFNAANFGASGASITVGADDDIAAAVTKTLTDPAVRAAAHKVRREILDTPTPAEVVPVLTGLA